DLGGMLLHRLGLNPGRRRARVLRSDLSYCTLARPVAVDGRSEELPELADHCLDLRLLQPGSGRFEVRERRGFMTTRLRDLASGWSWAGSTGLRRVIRTARLSAAGACRTSAMNVATTLCGSCDASIWEWIRMITNPLGFDNFYATSSSEVRI